MKSTAILTVFVLFVVTAAPARGQVLSYHHHSTAYGDAAAAQAELELARGIAERERAAADHIRAQAQKQWEQARYQQVENSFRRRELKQQRIHNAREANLRRAAVNAAKFAEAAEQLAADVCQGDYVWPASWQAQDFASTIQTVEHLLRKRQAGGNQLSRTERTELAKLSRELEQFVRVTPQGRLMKFTERCRVIDVAKQLDYLSRTSPRIAVTALNGLSPAVQPTLVDGSPKAARPVF